MAAKLSSIVIRSAPPSRTTNVATTAPGEPSDVVQLKPYVVREDRAPEFKEREILTPKGKLELARRRYPGLGPLSGSTALMMLEEDFAKERRQELADLKGLLEIGGTQLSPAVIRKIDKAVVRPSGFSPEFGAPFRTPK